MAQKNRAQMLTDITTNIFNNVINFITGQNAQDRLVNLLDSSPNIISDKDQPDGYVGLDAVGNMFSSYYNENISRADLVTLLTTNTAVTYKLYQVNDAVGATKILLVIADSNITLYPFAIDLTTAEIGTYDINTDTFTVLAGSGNASIIPITEAALGALETANNLNLNALYVVTNSSPFVVMCKAESVSALSRTATIIDTVYSGSVDYDVQSGIMYNIVVSDGGNKPNQYFGVDTGSWTLGVSCVANIFYQRSGGSLGDNCINNIFEQEASSNILDESCSNNTFKQYASGFTFGIALQNVTIEAGTLGADYTASPTYDFLYNNTYPSTIFFDGTDNYHRYYDPANDRIVLTNLTTLAVSYIGGGGVQSVTAGTNISVTGTSTNPIINSLSDRYKTSSTTSNTISNGSKTFTVDADLAYIPLQEVLIVFDTSNHMHARVTSYSGTTLVVDVLQHTGSGTYTSWVINLDGTPVDAITGSGTANQIAYFTAQQVIASLDTATYPSLTELSYVKGATSAIQTQINNVAPISNVGTGVTVTGTTANTISDSLLVPANSRKAGQVVTIIFATKKSGGANTHQPRLYWNTTPSLTGAILVASNGAHAAAVQSSFTIRDSAIEVANGTLNGTMFFPTTVNANNPYGAITAPINNVAINWTAAGYFIVAIQNGSALDSSSCAFITLK